MASEQAKLAAAVVDDDPSQIPEQPTKKSKNPKEVPSSREPGDKTTFPISRVQRIIKADKEIPIVVREATFLIALAAEEFLKKYSEAAYNLASRDRRTTVQYKDNATLVRKADEFLFLEEITPWTDSNAPAKRKPKAIEERERGEQTSTMLDQYVAGRTADEETLESGARVFVNDDGTMGMEE